MPLTSLEYRKVENSTPEKDRTINALSSLIEIYKAKRERIQQELTQSISKLDATIEQLSLTYREEIGAEANTDSQIGNFTDPPKAESTASSLLTHGHLKRVGEPDPTYPHEGEAATTPPKPERSQHSLWFPESKFIGEEGIEAAILKYFPTRKTAPTALDIFNKFYRSKKGDWSAKKDLEVRDNMRQLLEDGVRRGLWVVEDGRYRAKS